MNSGQSAQNGSSPAQSLRNANANPIIRRATICPSGELPAVRRMTESEMNEKGGGGEPIAGKGIVRLSLSSQ